MKKHIIKGIAALSTAMMLYTGVFAAAPTVVYDYSNNRVTVSGKTDSERVVLNVLKKGNSIESLNNTAADGDIILYGKQLDSEAFVDGAYTFSVRYAALDDETFQNGAYNAYLVESTGEITPLTLELFTKIGYEAVVESLNSYANAANLTEFKKLLKDNQPILGFNKELFESLTAENALKPCMDYIAKNNLAATKSTENGQLLSRFMIMQAISEGKLNNSATYISDAVDIFSDIYKNYQKYTADAEGSPNTQKQEYLIQKMAAAIPAEYSYTDFETALKQGIILTCIRWADGYAAVKNVLTSYGSAVGITTTAADSVYRSLCGNDYTATTLKDAFDKANTPQGGENGGLGGSGGSGGSGSLGAISAGSQYTMEETEKNKTDEIRMYFNDIEGVDWANEAILALADKGIINGDGEGNFKPDDFVTREEFTKILVGAMGLSDSSFNGSTFEDVNSNDWFFKYVGIAYEKGIVNGIGNGKFGTGELISRQDMATMICNALKQKGNILPASSFEFSDSGLIADYAKPAVSALYEMGAVNGVSETHFDPLGKATRAQAAKIIYGVFEKLQ